MKELWGRYKGDFFVGMAVFILAAAVGAIYAHTLAAKGIELFYLPNDAVSPPGILWPLYPYGIFFALTNVLYYGLFRLGMRRAIAATVTLLMITSPFQLYHLIPSIGRDYAKAPFFLAMILLMGVLVIVPLKKSQGWILSGIAGFVLSLGLLVRQDLLVVIPPFILTVLFLTPGGRKDKFIALAIFIVTCASLMPLSAAFREKNYAPTRILGGLMEPLNHNLGIESASYDWGYLWEDEFAQTFMYAQAQVKDPLRQFNFSPVEMAQLTRPFILKVSHYYPADLLLRCYASILKILEIPFSYLNAPPGCNSRFVELFYTVRAVILGTFSGFGIILAAATLFFLSEKGLRRFLFVSLILLYFGAYPALSFQGRHYFYLEFFALFALGYLISLLSKNRAELWTKMYSKALHVGAVFLSLFLALLILRAFQTRSVKQLLKDYAQARRTRATLQKRRLNDTLVGFTSEAWMQPQARAPVGLKLLAATFRNATTEMQNLTPIFRFQSQGSKRLDFSRSYQLSLKPQETKTVYFPIVLLNNVLYPDSKVPVGNKFLGIELPNAQASFLSAADLINDPGNLPLIFWNALPALQSYQKLSRNPETKIEVTFQKLDTSATFLYQSSIIKKDGASWEINGEAQKPKDAFINPLVERSNAQLASSFFPEMAIGHADSDLLIANPSKRQKGEALYAEGTLKVGGLVIVVLKGQEPIEYARITKPGHFSVALRVPEDGEYTFGLANDLDIYTALENRAHIEHLGWLPKI